MVKPYRIGITVLSLCLVDQIVAGPMKCVVNGKTVYTNDSAHCANGELKPINGSVVIASPTPKSASAKLMPMPSPDLPLGLDGILQQLGLTPQELENGWKTVMDARERGSWKAPDLPDDQE